MFGNLLGKRPPADSPIPDPSASGTLPDDVEGPPAAKPREQAPVSLEARFDELEGIVAKQGQYIKTLQGMVGGLNAIMEKQDGQLRDTELALSTVKAEMAELKLALGKTDGVCTTLGHQVKEVKDEVTKPSYAAAAAARGSNAAASELRAAQDKNKEDIEQLRQQAEQQDRLSRAANVMLFGLEETDRMSPAEQVSECLRSVGAPARDSIVRAVRVGQQRGSQPRPVKVIMATQADAVGVLRRTRELRQRRQVRADRDLTPAQTEKRKAQLDAAKDIRELGYITVFNAEKLLFFKKGSGRRTVYTGSLPPRA